MIPCNICKIYKLYVDCNDNHCIICRYIPEIYIKLLSTAKRKVLLFYTKPFEYSLRSTARPPDPVAFIPIYYSEKSKRQTQGYECDAARGTILYHDCWRHILRQWKDKTQNFSFGVTWHCWQRQQARGSLVSWLIVG